MRELAVFYCPKCGYYAYYQTSRHPQCPRCFYPDEMHMVRMHYREFMDMGCKERDDYLALEILNSLENDDSLKNPPEDTATAKPSASEHTHH